MNGNCLSFYLVPCSVVIGSNCDMIDFVGTPPFLRVAEWVAMEIMHFHATHNMFIFRTIFRMKEVPINNLSTTRNCHGCMVGLISCQGKAD